MSGAAGWVGLARVIAVDFFWRAEVRRKNNGPIFKQLFVLCFLSARRVEASATALQDPIF